MTFVKAKKFLGQHFLTDENIARKISAAVILPGSPKVILEIGSGTGALTKHLFSEKGYQTFATDVDMDSIEYLREKFPEQKEKIIYQDFLSCDFDKFFEPFFPGGLKRFTVIGNFPYNISSQILFKILKHRNQIPFIVGMFQKEVAQRIASVHGNKSYGILSVLMQTFYKVDYLFEVPPGSFNPPPKVNSAVLRFSIIPDKKISCSEKMFFLTIKTAFNQRRKTLRNALKNILSESFPRDFEMLGKRAEQLSPAQFEILAGMIEKE